MASFEGVGSGTTGAQYYTLKLEVYEKSFSIPNNNSEVPWALYLTSRNNYSFSTWGFPVTVNIDNEEVYNSDEYRSMSANSTLLIASGTKTIAHNSDGKKTISCSATVKATGAYYLPGNISVSGTLKLTDIPRTSSVSCNSFNIGDATTIVISRASSSFTHTVTWAFGSASGTIATKTGSTTIGTTISASSLYAQIPNAKLGTGTITCQTYSGDTLIGTSTCSFTAYAKESDCIPTVSATIVDTNDATIALTGSNTTFIKGFSNAKVTISATAKNSATIKSYATSTGDGRSSTTATTTFSNIGSNQVSVRATDSRGYSKTSSYTLSWINYVMLAFTRIEVKRPESTADQANITVKGNYYNASFGKVSNSLTLQYRYKESGGSYSNWTAVTPTLSGNTFTYTKLLENLSHEKEYIFQFMIDDQLMTVYSNEESGVLTKGTPIIRVGSDYMRVSGKDVLVKNIVTKSLDTQGWYRVAKLEQKGYLVNIHTLYNNTNNMSTMLAINITYRNAKIAELSTKENASWPIISSARVVLDTDNETYLEIYYNFSVSNTVYVELSGNTSHAEMLNFEATTNTVTVLDEFSIGRNEIDIVSLFQNGWKRHYDFAQCFKKNNIVHLNFGCSGGTTAKILDLPEGFRPSVITQVPIIAIGATGILTINPSGEVTCTSNLVNYQQSALYINCTFKL